MILALAGCAGTRGPDAGAGKGADADAGEMPPGVAEGTPSRGAGVVEHQVGNRAVAMLWDQSEQARREGNLEAAIASLERAVRLAPNDPVLWSRLSELRFRERDFAVAENLAAKSNALAGDRTLLRFRNWLIIAEARARRGDEQGAEQARAEARRLRGNGDGG